MLAIIDGVRCTQLPSARQFCVRRRSNDRLHPHRSRELQRKDRHAACSLNQHLGARLQTGIFKHSAPGSQRGTGQCRGLEISQRCRRRVDPLGQQRDELARYALVGFAWHSRPAHVLRDRARHPSLKKERRDTVAHLRLRYTLSNRVNCTCTVRHRRERRRRRTRGFEFDHREIAVVEAGRRHLHYDFTGLRLRHSCVRKAEAVNAPLPCYSKLLHIVAPCPNVTQRRAKLAIASAKASGCSTQAR